MKWHDVLIKVFEIVSGAENGQEFCSFENFNPICSKNEVIVITRAIYGRMKEGRCLELNTKISMADKQDPQYFGCSDDVLDFMDRKCSGRTECNVRANDQEMRRKSSCYKDLEKYLEASHLCVSGKYLHECRFNHFRMVMISVQNLEDRYIFGKDTRTHSTYSTNASFVMNLVTCESKNCMGYFASPIFFSGSM